ncbi:MAG: (d)CMP kinase [Deltaproteobacteria bacterium]|nr:(d)CMP kinase [Deltaproteobacteria bacterium]
MRKLLITIDGPAGAGKTTVSRMLSEQLGYIYVDTGALYRGVAFEVIKKGVKSDDAEGLRTLCETLDLKFVLEQKSLSLISNGKNISDLIRTPEITMMASAVSAKQVVRDFLFDLQRQLGKDKCVVFEGRDMGTVVFPDADVKFYLDAAAEDRAKRRYNEMKDKSTQTLHEIEKDILKRDKDDSTRNIAPLKPAKDAILIDSTPLSASEVVDNMMIYVKQIGESY